MSEVYVGKNVGFACHIFGRELCRNRSETAFFGARFRLRTFLVGGYLNEKMDTSIFCSVFRFHIFC